MKAYINGIGNISPQLTYDNSVFLNSVKPLQFPFARCEEPNYKELINPMQLRRMGRILRMGVTAAGIALKESGVENPDAIITGTGLGLVQDTEKFLLSLLENDEKLLNPTSFIQSTHNTVGAHIAVMLKCNNYNYTYVNSSISFESALLDSLMQVEENPAASILLGGLDEMTEMYHKITYRAGMWNKYNPGIDQPGNLESDNVIAGEGSAYFVLSGKKHPACYAVFEDTETFYKPASTEKIATNILGFLEKNKLHPEEIDLVIFGQQDAEGDIIYQDIRKNLFRNNSQARYKHLCGEYYTSSAFASWLGANILKRQTIPADTLITAKPGAPTKKILIYNHFRNIYHSVILMSEC